MISSSRLIPSCWKNSPFQEVLKLFKKQQRNVRPREQLKPYLFQYEDQKPTGLFQVRSLKSKGPSPFALNHGINMPQQSFFWHILMLLQHFQLIPNQYLQSSLAVRCLSRIFPFNKQRNHNILPWVNLTSFTGYVIDVEIKWFSWDKIILTTLSWDRPDPSSHILLWAVVEFGPFKLGSLFYTYQVSQLICSSMIWTQHWPEVAEVVGCFVKYKTKSQCEIHLLF